MCFSFRVDARFLRVARALRLRERAFRRARAARGTCVDAHAIANLRADAVLHHRRAHHAGHGSRADGKRAAGRAHVELEIAARVYRHAATALGAVGNGDARLTDAGDGGHGRCRQADEVGKIADLSGDGVFDDHSVHRRARADGACADCARAADRCQRAGGVGDHADGVIRAHGDGPPQFGGGFGTADGGQRRAGERRRAERGRAGHGDVKGAVVGKGREGDIARLCRQCGPIARAGDDRLLKQVRADARAERGGGIARRGCQHAGDELRVVFRVDAHMAVFGDEGTALQCLSAGLGRSDGHADGARGGGGGCARAGGRGQYVEKGVGTRGLDAHIARGDGAFPARLGDGGVFVHEHGDGAARSHGRARSQAHVRRDEREFGIVLRGEGKRAVCIDERMVAQRRLRARAGEDDVDAAADGRAARAGGHRVRRGHSPDVVLRGRLYGDIARSGHGACIAHAGIGAVAPLGDGYGRTHANLGGRTRDRAGDDTRGGRAARLNAQTFIFARAKDK